MSSMQGSTDLKHTLEELRLAIDNRNINKMDDIIAKQSNVPDGKALLADALVLSCVKDWHEAVEHLLREKGVDPNLPSRAIEKYQGVPPLIVVVKATTGDQPSLSLARGIEIVKLLFQYDAKLAATDPNNETALSHVVDVQMAEVLLSNIDDSDRQAALAQRDPKNGCNALLHALQRRNDSSIAELLIRKGASIRTVDFAGRTALMTAAWKNHTSVVQKMILTDPDVLLAKDNRKRNIWHHLACDVDHRWGRELIDILLAVDDPNGVKDIDEKGQTCLHYSAIWGGKDLAQALFDKYKMPTDAIEPIKSKTPLHLAAAHGNTEIASFIVAHGADTNARCCSIDAGNLTPLHVACGHGDDIVDFVQLLINHHANLEALTDEKMTPLHIAASQGQADIVEYLLGQSAKVNALCTGDWTPLHLACCGGSQSQETNDDARSTTSRRDFVRVVKALVSADADINRKSLAFKTPLHLAAELGHKDIVQQLLESDDVHIAPRDNQGNTPLLDAAQAGQHLVVPLLAPWTSASIRSLPPEAKQVTTEFDANIVDFMSDKKPRRYRVPLFNVLHHSSDHAGQVSSENVSTKPVDGGFRWIHLPANNLSWCHALLTKWFIENGSQDVECFKALERSLGQQQHHGQTIHSLHMRPASNLLPDQARGRPSSPVVNYKPTSRPKPIDPRSSVEVPNPSDMTPPKIEVSQEQTDLDRKGLFDSKIRSRSANEAVGDAPSPNSFKQKDQFRPKPDTNANGKGPPDAIQARVYLFMPFLELGKREAVYKPERTSNEESQTTKAVRPGFQPANAPKSDGIETTGTIDDRDQRLLRAYADWKYNEFSLHIRRTLDQFRYKNVNTDRRDADQVLSRYHARNHTRKTTSEQIDDDILVVDQLWIWILGPDLVVTSFPQSRQQSRDATPDLLCSILDALDPRTGEAVHDVTQLAISIVGECLSACDRSARRKGDASVFDVFSSSVGVTMDEEVQLFRKFEEDSSLVSGSDSDIPYVQDHRRIPAVSPKPGTETDQKPGGTNYDKPELVQKLLNLQREIVCLEEVKDIADELGILAHVMEDQIKAVKAMQKAVGVNFGPSVDQDWVQTLEQQKGEIEDMTKHTEKIISSINDLLEYKQRYAIAIEARSAGQQALSTAEAGRTLMVFTVVTVVFLPLSFLAAFFALSIEGLRQDENGEQQLTLDFVMRYVVGVGLGTASAFVAVAWYYGHVWHLIRHPKKTWTRFMIWLPAFVKRTKDRMENGKGRSGPNTNATGGGSEEGGSSSATSGSRLSFRRGHHHKDEETGEI